MNYVVIETGGKQYKVTDGEILEVENLNLEKDKDVVFDKVLLQVFNGEVKIGVPYIDGAKVIGKLIDNIKGEKIDVYKFRAKSRHRRKIGFRSLLSKIKIEDIGIEKKTERVISQPKEKETKIKVAKNVKSKS